MADYNDFINHNDVPGILEQAEKKSEDASFIVSDIIDDNGYQYVDLVEEGGGVLGIALVGYTFLLEKAGIRFFDLAGTSAGAINTLLLAGLGTIDQPKGKELLDIINGMDLFKLVDGDKSMKKIIKKWIETKKFKKVIPKLLWNIFRIKKALLHEFGINPGQVFEDWINQSLSKGPGQASTINDIINLRRKDNYPAGLRHRLTQKPVEDPEARMAMITADITTRTKVNFPEMAYMYFENPFALKPATLVRSSMAVPMFFTPFKAPSIPHHGTSENKDWKDKANYAGIIPKSALFVDGGLISNFPINIFHIPGGGVPRKPTFGARLSAYRKKFTEVDDIGEYLGGLLGVMRHDSDEEFLKKNPDFKKLVCHIDADEQVFWLDFNLSDETKKDLFALGVRKAWDFLLKFDWDDYKERRKLIQQVDKIK